MIKKLRYVSLAVVSALFGWSIHRQSPDPFHLPDYRAVNLAALMFVVGVVVINRWG